MTKIHLPIPAAPAEETQQKPEPQGRARRRDSNIHIKVTPQEHELFKARVAQSGMTMTNYILRCTLQDGTLPPVNTQSIVESIESLQKQLLDLMAEVGRQGGMLKMVIRPNEGQRTRCPEETGFPVISISYEKKTSGAVGVWGFRAPTGSGCTHL